MIDFLSTHTSHIRCLFEDFMNALLDLNFRDMFIVSEVIKVKKLLIYTLADSGGDTRRAPPNGRGPLIFVCPKR